MNFYTYYYTRIGELSLEATNRSLESAKKSKLLPTVALFTAFIYFGISENIKGPALPLIQDSFQINEFQLGLLLSINALGFLIATVFAGMLIKKIDAKAVFNIALIIMGVSGIFIFISNSYISFSTAYFVLYFGNGLLEIVLNVLAARMFHKNAAIMLGLCHFFFGVGSITGPIAASELIGLQLGTITISWHGMYLVMMSVAIIPLIMGTSVNFPEKYQHSGVQTTVKDHIRNPIIWLLASIITLGVVVELSIASWLVNLMEKAYSWSPSSAAFLLASFFLLFTLGRLILSPIIEKIGYAKSLVIFTVFAGICIFLGLILGSPFEFFFALSGLGVAPIYQTVMAFVPELYGRDTDGVVNLIIIIWAVGSMLGNLLVGGLTNSFKVWAVSLYGEEIGLPLGLQLGFGFIGLLALLCGFFSLILQRKLPKKQAA